MVDVFVPLYVYPESFRAANKSCPTYIERTEWEDHKVCKNSLVCMRSGIPSSVNIHVAEKRRVDISHGEYENVSETPAYCQHQMTFKVGLKYIINGKRHVIKCTIKPLKEIKNRTFAHGNFTTIREKMRKLTLEMDHKDGNYLPVKDI